MEHSEGITQENLPSEGSVLFQQDKIVPLSIKKFIFYGVVIFAILYCIGIFLPSMSLWVVIFSSIVIAVPIGMFFAYRIVINETNSSLTFREGGIISWVLKRRVFLIIITCITAPPIAFLVMIHIAFMKATDWILLGVGYVAFFCIYRMVQRILNTESATWILYKRAAITSARITIIILFLVQILFIYMQLYDYPVHNNIEDAIKSRDILVAKCNIVTSLYDWAGMLGAVKAYFIGLIINNKFEFTVELILLSILTFSFYAGLVSIFAFVSVPFKEYKRISLQKNIHSTKLPFLSGVEIFITTLCCVLVMSMYTSGFIALNEAITHPEFKKIEDTMKASAQRTVIKVDDTIYDPNVEPAIDNIDQLFSARQQDAIRRILDADNMACEIMRGNVDGFLDWYYSIPAEYGRIGHLLVGEAEQYVQEKLTESLQKNLNLAGQEVALKALQGIKEEWLLARKAVGEQYRLSLEPPEGTKIIDMGKDFFTKLPENQSDLSFTVRVDISTPAASLAGVIAAGALAKPASKVALSALMKFVATKAATGTLGVGSGAALGAAVGSVVPGAGTAVGAIVGGVLAAGAVWVATDAVVLTLDEEINRDDFRKAIITTLDENYCNKSRFNNK